MSMRLVLVAVLLALPLRAVEKPNPVIRFTDDQRRDAVSYTGNGAVIRFISGDCHFSGQHGLAGEWLMCDPSLRVPGFLYEPRHHVAPTSDRMVLNTDFSASLLGLAVLSDITDPLPQ